MASPGKVLPMKPHKETRTKLDTILLDYKVLALWKAPPFQRPLKVNAKVQMLADTIREDGGVVPGTITLAVVSGVTYLIDGQHRIEAFKNSGCAEGFADVRTHFVDSMAEAGQEFVALNSALVRFNADDILRGLEDSTPGLKLLREACPFIGYDMIRRSPERGACVSMSTAIRSWLGSASEAPAAAESAPRLVAQDRTNVEQMTEAVGFFQIAYKAWGRDPENYRLWAALNLSLCMWLYRRLVLRPEGRVTKFSKEMFTKSMMSLSADKLYVDWLVGRHLAERDRSPAYRRIKGIFAERYFQEQKVKCVFPAPAWAAH